MKIIQLKFILEQLTFDLIGKDSYRGVTLTYAWLANQFGHIALGFIPTFLIYQFLKQYIKSNSLNIFIAIGVTSFWFLFELYNVLAPLFKNNQIYNFKPDLYNVIFDTITDICFFAIGAFLAALAIKYTNYLLAINAMLVMLVIYPSYYWYTTKMYQQEAKFPFQMRLSQWKTNLDENSKNTINQFVNKNSSGHHLLVFGAYKSGKTSLSVAIANEQSIKHKKALYTSATKFYNLLYEPSPKENELKINNLWSWRNTDFLVIDDINPSLKINGINVEPNTFYNLLNNEQFGQENIKAIQNTNIIWVLGENNSNCCDWKQLLISMGIKNEKISELTLL
ncbi:MAG: DnaA ATPase domain-containing protein [Candidatus Methylacidiphilales bacterium]